MLRLVRPVRFLPDPAPRRAIAGRLALVAVGLAALTLVALLAPVLWHAPAPRDDVPPNVWLGTLVAPPPGGFAAADYRAEAQLPRQRPPLPPPAPQNAAAPGAPVPVATVPVVPVATAPVDLASSPEAALAAVRAPTRSLVPRARPIPAESQPLLASLGPQGGLLRSLFPSPRPETVTRLASLDLATPQPEAPRTPSLSIPQIDQAVADGCGSSLVRAIPRRGGGMANGSTVIAALAGSGGRSRDDAIADQIASGNLPDFLRDLVPVTFTSGEGRQRTRITLCVMPDYLAVGSDRDFVRVPLGLPAAMRLAERFDMVLPTTRMVDAIHAQASVRLAPSPMEPGAQMASTAYFLRHNATVEGQRQRAGGRLGQLVAGHKKDLVLTNRLNTNPGRVAIYGWHRGNGAPIQPLSTVHGADYADYSHGIRLISRTAYVNGRAVDLRDLLGDSRLAGLVSSEGTITNRQLLAALR